MKRSCFVVLLLSLSLALAAAPALADNAEGSFDRELKISGPVDLEVSTGSGYITVRSGDTGTVRVHALIRAQSWFSGRSAEEKVKALQANPPVKQTGNSIRIGHIEDPELRHNVSISYEITTPMETQLKTETGSGSQTVDGLRGPVSVSAGSGNVRVSNISSEVRASSGSGRIELDSVKGSVRANAGSGGIRGSHVGGAFTASTGSGDITFDQTAPGDVDVQTGSGRVNLQNVHGALRAETGSGRIEADGDPTGRWQLHTGSGRVGLRLPAQAAFELDARTGSGKITVDHPVTMQGSLQRNEVRGRVRGGGVMVSVRTSSGDIIIQ
jgi:hypothetical protein